MLISLCLIVHNGVWSLSRALESVKNVVDELIVVDTGYSEHVKKIASEYGAKVFSNRWHLNINEIRNFAFEQANGDWVLFLNADEELEENSHQLRSLLKNTEVDGFYLPVVDINDSKNLYLPRLNLRLFRRNLGFKFSEKQNEQISGNSILGNIENSIKVLHLPIIRHNKYYFLKDELNPSNIYYFQVNEDIDINSPSFVFIRDSINLFWQGNLFQALHKLYDGLEKASGNEKITFLSNIIFILLELKQFKHAEKKINESLKEYPSKQIFYFWRGYLDYRFKRYFSGITYLQNVLGRKVFSPKLKSSTYLLLGMMYKQLDKKKVAIYYFKKAYLTWFETEHLLSNFLDLFDQSKEREIINFLTGENHRSGLGLSLIKTYYRRREYKFAYNLIESRFQNNNNEDFLFWKAKVLLQLKEYKSAKNIFKKISPGSPRYKKVLDNLWIINVGSRIEKESKSVINQIKLTGDKLSYNVINVFNQIFFYGKEVRIEFNSYLTQLKFYKRALYYLDLLIEYSLEKGIETMLEIIESLQVRTKEKEIGYLFYKHGKYKWSYDFILESLTKGETITDLIYLADICDHLNRNKEREIILEKIYNLDPHLGIVYGDKNINNIK